MSALEPERRLRELDPQQGDDRYWSRFQVRIMEAAAPALAARRERARMTVGGVFLSWSRLVVPATVTAAAVAALILLQGGPTEEVAVEVGVEELLWSAEEEADPLPAFLRTEQVVDRDVVLFALEEY